MCYEECHLGVLLSSLAVPVPNFLGNLRVPFYLFLNCNYEIPVGDFILFLLFLLFFFFFSFSYWFCEPEKNLAGRPGKGMPNYQKLVLKGFSEGHEPSLKLKIFRTKKFIKKKLFKLKF